MLDEIRRIIKERSYLADAVEKPVSVAGNFRGIGEEVAHNGQDVVANGVYVRTIRLEH